MCEHPACGSHVEEPRSDSGAATWTDEPGIIQNTVNLHISPSFIVNKFAINEPNSLK